MQNLFSGKILCAILMILCLGRIQALTYYISPNGNDNAAGTSPGTAWQSISKVNSITLLPGTVVLFEGGQNFSGSIYIDAADGNNISNPIVISSYGSGRATIQSGASIGLNANNTKGFQVSNLIFEGAGASTNSTNGIQLYTNVAGSIRLANIKITNVEVRNYGVVGLSIYSANNNAGFKDVLIDQAHIHNVRENGIFIGASSAQVGWSHQNITIRNTEVDHVTGYADPGTHRGSGIIMAQVDSGLIEKCVAHHNGTSNIHCGGPGGVWAFDCNNVTIQHCESYSNSSGSGCDGLGFDLDGGMVNSTLQYNYSHNNDGSGYLLGQYDNARPWSNNVVRYNISENDGRTNAGGITLFKGANTTMNGCKIYNNTIYTSSSSSNANVGAFTIINWNTGMTGIEVYNNIFQTTGGASLIDIPAGYNIFFAGNLYWSTGNTFKIKYHGTTYNNVNDWRTASSNEKVGSLLTGVTADPLLTNAGNGTIVWPSPTYSLNAYHTSASSPVINAGLNLSNLFAINTGTIDFFNSVLPAANLRDIGAYENPASSTTAILDEAATVSEQISFYPNPVIGGELLNLKGGDAPYLLELLNINGSTILKETIHGSSYPIPGDQLPTGIYIIRIIDSKKRVSSGKIVIY